MKLAILLCLVAAATANPLVSDVLSRSGACPTSYEGDVSTLSRCSGYDFDCQTPGQDNFKCCRIQDMNVCVQPINVPVVSMIETEVTTPVTLRNQIEEAIEKTRDYIWKVGKYSPPESKYMKPITPDTIRWCISKPCQMKKCQRMVNEFTYNPTMEPRKQWQCMKAESQQQCMFWIEQGWADIMTVRDNDVFDAKTIFDLKPIAYETRITDEEPEINSMKYYQNVTYVVKLARRSQPETWADIQGMTSCHSGVHMPASFKAPVCGLINEEVMPATGDYVESLSDFVQESCVPGILNKTYNKNGTYPKSLVALCEDQQHDFSGIDGSLRCLESSKGQVTFVDQKTIRRFIADESLRNNFEVVCREESKDITAQVIEDTTCQVGHIARPTIFISKNNTDTKVQAMKDLLIRAYEVYGSTDPTTKFNLFDSSVYECEVCRNAGITGKPCNKNMLFLDESNTLKLIDPDKVYAEKYFQAYNTCSKLTGKPRAKFCVTCQRKYEACMKFKDVAENLPLVKDIAWGCVLANSSMECMKAVHNNTADLFSTKPVETFIAGKEFLLDPLMSIHHNDSITMNHTFTRTLAVMKATSLTKFPDLLRIPDSEPKFITDFRNLSTCHGNLMNISAFHHPIGWMLANGTIPRIGSVFESVNRFFENTCLPGVDPHTWRWDSDLLLGHELNWGYPGLNFYNFTGKDWLLWNVPATWDYLTYNRKVSEGLNLKKLLELKKNMNITLFKDQMDKSFDVEMLDDLVGVEGVSDLLRGLKETIGLKSGHLGDGIFRDRLRTMYPSFVGDSRQTFSDKVDTLNRLRDVRRRSTPTLNDLDTTHEEFMTTMTRQFKAPIITTMFSKLLELRSDKIETLSELIAHLKVVPTLTNYKDEDITTWLKHPALKSYIQVYFPRLSQVYSDMFDNIELREREFNRYTNPLWLSPKINEFLEIVKAQQLKITSGCDFNARGHPHLTHSFSDHNPNPQSNFEGYEGSLRCLKSGVADIAFFDEQTIKNTAVLSQFGFTYSDLRLVCPNGQVVELDVDLDIAKVCNFGEVVNPAIVTAYNRSGSWRWNVTKALMIAHQSQARYSLFGEETLMGNKYNKLIPITLLNQTYQTFLGPMLLRSFEAIIKPSSYDWFKDQKGICYGETFTNVVKQRNDTCQAIVKDVTCVGTPRMKKVSVGKFGEKQYKLVKMCSRPSKFVRKMAEFTCNNGHGYLKPVVTAIACECVPCEETIEFNATFAQDRMWTDDNTKYTPLAVDVVTDPAMENPYEGIPIWGNWSFWYNHDLNENFKLGSKTIEIEQVVEVINEENMPEVEVPEQPTEADMETTQLLNTPILEKTCEKIWTGKTWKKEWFPGMSSETCVKPVPGANIRPRINRLRDTFGDRRRGMFGSRRN